MKRNRKKWTNKNQSSSFFAGVLKDTRRIKTYHRNDSNDGRERQMELSCSKILVFSQKVSKTILDYKK